VATALTIISTTVNYISWQSTNYCCGHCHIVYS